jgi:hypothetical protein
MVDRSLCVLYLLRVIEVVFVFDLFCQFYCSCCEQSILQIFTHFLLHCARRKGQRCSCLGEIFGELEQYGNWQWKRYEAVDLIYSSLP